MGSTSSKDTRVRQAYTQPLVVSRIVKVADLYQSCATPPCEGGADFGGFRRPKR